MRVAYMHTSRALKVVEFMSLLCEGGIMGDGESAVQI